MPPALTACGAATGKELESPLLNERFLDGRLAHQSRWAACTVGDSSKLIAQSRCGVPLRLGDPAFEELAAAARDAAIRRRSDTSVKALRGSALFDLRWSATGPSGIDRAIASLAEAARRAPNDAGGLNDLAVAYLARAERDQQLRSLLQALDVIEQARAIDDTLAPAMFNQALILQRLNLVQSARRAWQRYLNAERSPAWRAEALAHLRALEAFVRDGQVATPSADALLADSGQRTRGELAALARRTPQWARETGFVLLGEWGKAVLRADPSRAASALSVARDLARSLTDAGRDASLSLAVAAIDGPHLAIADTRALARGHADYVDGYQHYARGAYGDAARLLGQAERTLRSLGSRAAEWAALYKAVALINRGEFELGDRVLRDVATVAPPTAPALYGKAIWVLGLSQVGRGAYEAASLRYREAVPFFIRAGETESLGMLSSLLAETLALAGQSSAGQVEVLRGLSLLAAYQRSGFLSGHLGLVADYARADGLHYAAVAVFGEVLENSVTTAQPQLAAWARGERARNFTELGKLDLARAELADAAQRMARIDDRAARDQFRAEIMLAHAKLIRVTDPAGARDELLRAVDMYRTTKNEIALPTALYQAALAAGDAGDTLTERRCLEEAVVRIEARHTLFPKVAMRASFYETMEGVFDALIALELEAGRPAVAFRYLERARAAAWTANRNAVPAPSIGDVQRYVPPHSVMLEYAVLADRVVVWSITRTAWHHQTLPVARDSVATLIRHFDAESDSLTVSGSGVRARLYDVLLAAVSPELGTATTVVVVPDRELSRLPFAALWSRSTARYLVETASVRTLPSAAFLIESSRLDHGYVRQSSGVRALVVGDPAFDQLAVPQLDRLPGAAREAARVADLYPQHTLLTGQQASRNTTLASLNTSSIFHFAGHAITNVDQPELSYLSLAADGPRSDGILHAQEIATLRLSNLMMVVLSGCSTLGTRATHVGALAGLAYSFLHAHAPATVSSLWDVDDETTTPVLVAFHRHLASGESAAGALRSAQMEALQSQQAAVRAPRTWAAFVYTGP